MTARTRLHRLWALASIVALLVAMLPVGSILTMPASAATAVFINEIHYDNTGTDTGEAIEVAGPAGTDLTGWSIVLYNGNGGAVYNTAGLAGTLPDQEAGYGTLSVAIAGIQNGAPDGLALVDAASSVVQFLSYEGSFMAVGGPADGMISTDIGVSQNGSGAVGNSLQLTGTGTMYEDFTWAAEAPNTFGAVNSGQSFDTGGPTPTPTPTDVPAGPASLVINEIDYDQASTDTAEFVEIKNIGTTTVDLSTITLELVNGSSGGALLYQSFALPAAMLAAGDYFVVCGDAANVPNCDLDVVPDTNLVQNGAPDAVGLRDSGTLIDAVSYEGNTGAPYTEGSGTGLADDPSVELAGISRFPDGSDTDVNNVDLSLRCATPGEANVSDSSDCVPAAPASLVINEIDYDQPSTDTAEFVEIKNTGSEPVDLSTVTLELVNGTGGGAVLYQTFALPSVTLAAGDYFVVCGDAANVANCDLDVLPDTNLVQNGAPDAVGLRDDSVLIDAVSYEGDTGAPYTEGSGIGLEDDPSVELAGISRFPDGSDTNVNNVDLSLRCSTPGETNVEASTGCVPIGAPDVVISEIRIDQPSTDNDEYFELGGAAGTALDGLTYLVIGDGTGGSGVIENATDLTGSVISASGFFVAAEGTFSFGTADLTTDLNFENGDNVTHVLVFEFSGANGDDLDTDDDGILDATPWTSVVDLIALVQEPNPPGGTEFHYGPPSIGPDGSFVPGHAFLCDDGWRIGSFSGGQDTPGAANACAPAVIEAKIHEVQGSGAASPLVGSTVIVEGIVVGDFQDAASGVHGDLNGFYLQEEDADVDANPLTSEGIFVFDGTSPAVDVQLGDLVRVEGDVSEFNGLTEITSFAGVTLMGSGQPLPSAASPTLPVSAVDEFEAFEGMRISLSQTLFISEYFNFDRFGEIVLTTERQFQPTAIEDPGSAAAADVAADNALGRIMLDDGRTSQNSDPAIHPNGSEFTLANRFRGGDTVANVTGVMDYAFGLYRIHPTDGASYTAANPRPAAPEDVGGRLTVASFNVLNYFTTIDTGAFVCGPAGNQECRGADNSEELERQRAKIVAALAAMQADVVGLIEIQNDDDTSVADLVAGLNAALGAGTYDYISTGFIGTDAIKQALIYRPASVEPVGSHQLLTSAVDSRYDDSRNRPALAQAFLEQASGSTFTVVVNHLKSKGSACGPGDDDPQQGNCNQTRTLAAQALVDWVATDPTGSGSPNYLIMGDLNAYDKEDPIDAILEGADDTPGTSDDWTDLVHLYQGEHAYSYVFDGQLGYLDHGLASGEMLASITGTTIWHVNADEPDILDYDTTFKQPPQDALYEPNAYRSSDHDPVIVGLALADQVAPELTVSVEPSELWPANHKYVDVEVTLSVSDAVDPNPTVVFISVFSDEPDNGPGDGNTINDIVVVDETHFRLRAERAAGGDGRTYTITYLATDASGNTTLASATVTVPMSRGKGR